MSKPSSNFAHLHVHTEYSMLDGAARVNDLVTEAAKQEMPAVAITDHGNLFGAFDFYKQAKKVGIKPSVGEHFLQADKGKKFNKGGALQGCAMKGRTKGRMV